MHLNKQPTGKNLREELDTKLKELGSPHDGLYYLQADDAESSFQDPEERDISPVIDIAAAIELAVSDVILSLRTPDDRLSPFEIIDELLGTFENHDDASETRTVHNDAFDFHFGVTPLREKDVERIRAMILGLRKQDIPGLQP